jgi:hypothetical protein
LIFWKSIGLDASTAPLGWHPAGIAAASSSAANMTGAGEKFPNRFITAPQYANIARSVIAPAQPRRRRRE